MFGRQSLAFRLDKSKLQTERATFCVEQPASTRMTCREWGAQALVASLNQRRSFFSGWSVVHHC